MGLLNATCNSTLDDMRIGDNDEVPIVGQLRFHDLALIIGAGCTLISILCSFFLIFMHAINYTKPYEQRHIIRILFMVPVYAASSLLSIYYYYHAVYFDVISTCYEAFAIASFFALLCHYIAQDLHHQKAYFRGIVVKPWVLPINWMKKCCGGERGPWRTPRSGLTWFNIIWTGVYQYCFLRVSMTIVAVLTQYFGKYCESSNSPLFAHIWVLVVEGIAVSIAMYCLIQFYVQLRVDLAPHRPFLKVAAIKLVIFLSFWQSFMISILTSSTLQIVEPTSHIAYPDLKIVIPSLLLCIEMAIFSILHLFAFRYTPYTQKAASRSEPKTYPLSPTSDQSEIIVNEIGPKQGGFLGVKAFVDAMNPWDLVKGFARGMRWLFVGVKNRESDPSYKKKNNEFDLAFSDIENDMASGLTRPPKSGHRYKPTADLPIAMEFRRSKFGMPTSQSPLREEEATLLSNAQNPGGSGYVPARQRYDSNGQDISTGGTAYDSQFNSPQRGNAEQTGMAVSGPPQDRLMRGQGAQAQRYMEDKRLRQEQSLIEPRAYTSRTNSRDQERSPIDPRTSSSRTNSNSRSRSSEPPPPNPQSHVNDELWGAGQITSPPRSQRS